MAEVVSVALELSSDEVELKPSAGLLADSGNCYLQLCKEKVNKNTLFNRCVLGVSLDINYEWRYYFILSLSASPEKCLKRTLQSFALLARSLKELITSEFFFCLSTRTQRLHHLIEQKELCC